MCAVAPGVYILELANGSALNQLGHTVEVRIGMPLCTLLGGQLTFVLEIGLAHGTGFEDAVAERLFTIDVHAAIHRPDRNEGMVVIGRAADHGLDIFLFEALSPIYVLLGVGEFLGGERHVVGVDIADGHDVLGLEVVVVGFSSAMSANQCNVEFAACAFTGECAAG